jgi:hypothetical protein
MTHKPRRIRAFLLPFVLVLASTASAWGQEGCSDSSIKGGYGFNVTGNNAQGGAQYILSGRFVADGKGHFAGTGTHTLSGKFGGRFHFTGTYTVAADCSGTASFIYPDGNSAPLDIVIVSDGNEIYMIVAADGPMEAGTAKRQFWRHAK